MDLTSFLRRQWVAKKTVIASAREVRERTGKGVLSQLNEMVRLRLGPGRLRAGDYYMYGVYDDARFTPAGKREVLSWSPLDIAARLNDPTWRVVCNDKLICYGLLKGLNLPFPEIYAVYAPGGRHFGSVPSLSTARAVAAHLRERMRYPFFAKAVSGGYGRGASSIERLDPRQDRLVFTTGEEMDVEEYVRRYVFPARDGYLFQEHVSQHPLIERITGGRVGTLRIVVLRSDEGAHLFRAIWRIPVGRNITDNFLHGTQGNLVANVDRDTGTVTGVVQLKRDDAEGSGGAPCLGRSVEAHPDTGERIVGVTLPNWQVVVSTCMNGAAALPGLRYQSWDVALGTDGPVVLELNYRGGIDIMQIPGTAGFFDAEFRGFWDRYAV